MIDISCFYNQLMYKNSLILINALLEVKNDSLINKYVKDIVKRKEGN